MIVRDVAVRPNRQFSQEPLDVCLFEACETAARHVASVSLLRVSAVISAAADDHTDPESSVIPLVAA